jgi:hypothetical protein
MRQRRPEQLALPGTLDEVVQLRQQLRAADFRMGEMAEAIDELTTHVTAMTAQLEHARVQMRSEKQRGDDWMVKACEAQDRIYTLIEQLYSLRSSGRAPSETGLQVSMVRRLLGICHPDKWSQGQSATALAHELTVYLNAQREASS